MTQNICAPKKYSNNSCFNLKQLMELASAYNRFLVKSKLNPNDKRTFKGADLIDVKPNSTYLLLELRKRFNKICNGDDICLVHQAFMNEIITEVRDDILNNSFRPMGPKNPTEWLSTFDINNIMEQYEKIYDNFKFLGAVPLDCNELKHCSLYNLNFDNFDKNIRYIAVIFNLDKYGQSGSHWVTLFIDLNGEIYFCDSIGKPPNEYIQKIINNFLNYYKSKTGTNAIYKYNKNSYQKDETECGVYACNFIIRKLGGESFEEIVNNPLTFKEINSCRNLYFRNKPSAHKIHKKCEIINK